MQDVSMIVSKIAEMERGSKIVMNLPTKGEANSLRTRLYRQVKKSIIPEHQTQIFISMAKNEDNCTYDVSIGIYAPMKMTLVKPDGSKKEITTEMDSALTRVITAMRADGRSEEEIEEVKASWTE